MTLTKKQHYVSQVYLKAWANYDGKLRVIDKISGAEFYSSTENICHQRYYYEESMASPNNELEKEFGKYETPYGLARNFLNFVCKNAVKSRGDVAQTLVDALACVPKHLSALKEFAAICHVRTPAALAAMRSQLNSSSAPLALEASAVLESPYVMNKLAFESTLMDRFMNLHMCLFYSKHALDTCDWPCIPLAGGENHANFSYDIGRHPAAFALMIISPNIGIFFLPNIDKEPPLIIPNSMNAAMADQTKQVIYSAAHKFIIKS